MNINELMIGDWVLFLINITGGDTEYDPEIAEYQPMKINTICSWEVGGEVTSDYDVVNDPDELKPIPLTLEILEKNGFQRCEIHEIKYIGWKLNEDFSVEINSDDTFTWNDVSINYVHELQHALRLCNIEKDIEI